MKDNSDIGEGHCASEWGGRETGKFLFTDDEVRELIAAEREACAKIADASAERMRKFGQLHRDELREDSMGRCYARARQCKELAADIRKRAVEIDRIND